MLFSYLYEKKYALDACFKLSMKQGSLDQQSENDPEFSPGNGVYMHEKKFQAFLEVNANVPQVS
jgi:hypothetical protein